MEKINYKWWASGISGGVCETYEEVDNVTVFSAFADARDALAGHFRVWVRQYCAAVWLARRLRKSDLENGEAAL